MGKYWSCSLIRMREARLLGISRFLTRKSAGPGSRHKYIYLLSQITVRNAPKRGPKWRHGRKSSMGSPEKSQNFPVSERSRKQFAKIPDFHGPHAPDRYSEAIQPGARNFTIFDPKIGRTGQPENSLVSQRHMDRASKP